VKSISLLSTFRRNFLSPSSKSKSKPSRQPPWRMLFPVCFVHLSVLKMEAIRSSEASVKIYQIAPCCIFIGTAVRTTYIACARRKYLVLFTWKNLINGCVHSLEWRVKNGLEKLVLARPFSSHASSQTSCPTNRVYTYRNKRHQLTYILTVFPRSRLETCFQGSTLKWNLEAIYSKTWL
jgi:hypothetical protein